MNIYLFSTELPILVKISTTVIEILTFDKWSLKVYHFQKCAFLRCMELTLTSASM